MSQGTCHPKKEDWELVEDMTKDSVPVAQLQLISFPERWEGVTLLGRVKNFAKKERAILGQRQAECLLEHQEEIPPEWRNYYLFFPGTIYRESDHLLFLYLYWYGDKWHLDFDRFGLFLVPYVRVVGLK
ncbi:hypothetical protein HYT45_04910 [Candidatus Uhrbacteria bacterium]|nr:hypothetical protein [Candidatus Uhrbacteria bacterium]